MSQKHSTEVEQAKHYGHSLTTVVDVMKVTLCRTLHAASGGVKLTCVITPLDGSVGVKYDRKNVL